jgi:hypothetical protein
MSLELRILLVLVLVQLCCRLVAPGLGEMVKLWLQR